MKKNIFILVAVIVIVIFGGWLIFSNNNSLQTNSPGRTETSEEKIQEEIKGEVFLEIDDGDGEIKKITAKLTKGMTAVKLLEDKTIEMGLNLRTRTYSTGALIEAIGDKENGKDGKYWLYYVNGEMPQVSADKKELSPDDKVEFKFEKSPF